MDGLEPTNERMTELWLEMLGWATPHLWAFAMQLAHAAAVKNGTSMADAAMFDVKAQQPVYMAFARGPSTVLLRRAVAQACVGGVGRVVKQGDQGLETPMGVAGSAEVSPCDEAIARVGDAGYVRALLDRLAVMATEINRLNLRHLANIAERNRAREAAAAAEAERERAVEALKDLRWQLAVPEGAKRADAWIHKGQLIVCGDPVDTDGDVDHPDAHNCDAMGCSSVSHVVIRERLTEFGTLEVRRRLAAAEAKLPRLRDGAEPVSGTTIWRRIDAAFAVAGTVEGWEKPHTDEPWWVQCREWSSPLCDCYSTEAAALAAAAPAGAALEVAATGKKD